MKLHFRTLAIITALLAFALALTWMFAPDLLLSSWGVELSDPVALVGRRGAALYGGIGVMFFLARNAEPSAARSALVAGFMVSCSVLAALGVFELVMGRAGPGILLAVLVEIALVLAFSCVECSRKSRIENKTQVRDKQHR